MTTSLLIATAQYTVDAISITSSATVSTTNLVENLITGERSRFTELAADGTSWSIDFNFEALTSVTIDYFIVARANLLTWGSNRLLLTGYDGTTTTSLAGTSSDLGSVDLYGVRGEDIIFTADLANSDVGITMPVTGSYTKLTYWPCGSGTCESGKYKHSKMYCGQWFDPGRDPVHPARFEKVSRGKFDRESRYIFTLRWSGITDAKKNEFFTNLFDEPMKPVFLYTKTHHDILRDFRLIHCFVISHDVRWLAPDSNEISVTFEEMI